MQTIGELLKKYRLEGGLDIEAFEKITKIPQKYIQALEDNQFNKLPGGFYVKQHIKTYAKFLKLQEKKLLEVYEQQIGGGDIQVYHPQKQDITKEIITPARIRIVFLLCIALLLVGYLGYSVNKIYTPPHLEVTTPATNLIVTDTVIEIRGVTEPGSRVTINNRQIYTDSRGYFTTTLDMKQGINIVKIASQKKHSKESVVFREILVQ
ncbi:helix-turn-helix domain-containing protein [Candidatus Falkowbacteria bacterium]|nr:helix-turn-helix domain-containing protein [Candidatus Falkowbacteria bacterium]